MPVRPSKLADGMEDFDAGRKVAGKRPKKKKRKPVDHEGLSGGMADRAAQQIRKRQREMKEQIKRQGS